MKTKKRDSANKDFDIEVTRRDLSKKLAEIGFKSKTDHIVEEPADCGFYEPEARFRKSYPAYDLETLLEVLPKEVVIALDDRCFEFAHPSLQNYAVYSKENESLADTAARLLILLVEKGVLKFGEVKE